MFLSSSERGSHADPHFRSFYLRSRARAASMFWQTWTSNVDVRRQWDRLGVGTTIFQWVAVNGSSFILNPWLPLHGSQLDLADIATRPWARRMIIGTPGLSDETQARARIHELADLAQKFGTLSYPSNAAGFYFPVEIDPTYTAAPADFGAIWSKLPRPCTCRSTTAPASTTRPPRNGWTHSSPGRDHPVPGRRGRTRRDAAAGAGPLRPDPRATPEDRDDRRGLPSESHARRRLLHSRHGGRIPSAAAGLCAPGSGARLRRPQLPGRSADPAHRRRGARPAADSVERARQQLGRRAAGLATRQRRVGGGGEIPRRDPGRHGRASVAPL